MTPPYIVTAPHMFHEIFSDAAAAAAAAAAANVFELIKTRMDAIVQGTCAAYGAKGSLKFDIYGAPGGERRWRT